MFEPIPFKPISVESIRDKIHERLGMLGCPATKENYYKHSASCNELYKTNLETAYWNCCAEFIRSQNELNIALEELDGMILEAKVMKDIL
jgi:hypothetical protein